MMDQSNPDYSSLIFDEINQPTGAQNPTVKEINHALDIAGRDSLPPITSGFAVLYVVLTIGYALFLPQSEAVSTVIISALTAVILLCLNLIVSRWQVPIFLVRPLCIGIATLSLACGLAHLYLIGNPRPTLTLILVVIATGFFFLYTRWLIAIVLITFGSWWALSNLLVATEDLFYFRIAMFAATVLATLINVVRVRTRKRLEILRIQDAHRKRHLKAAVHNAHAALMERSQVQEALQRSEARWRSYVEQANDLIFTLNANGQFTSINRAMYEALGYENHEILGRSPLEFVISEDDGEVEDALSGIWKNTDQLEQIEVTMLTKNGQKLFLEIRGQAIHHDAQFFETFHIARDITERIQTEEALRQTQTLESLAIMAGGLAHDFNNLLASILSQAELTRGKLDKDHEGQQNIAKMIRSAEQAADLTRELLAYSGHSQFETRPIDINHLINENLPLFQAAIPHGIDLHLELSAYLPLIEGDSKQIRQVILHLLTNSVEAIEGKWGKISLSTGQYLLGEGESIILPYSSTSLMPGRYISIIIQDNGMGMDEETLAKIFDPFFTTKFTGRGLGLSAALGIINGHKGGIQVASMPGAGSQFTLLFPITQRRSITEGDIRAVALSDPPPTQVLVIDDEEPVREAVMEILEIEGIKAITAPDGSTGVSIYAEQQAEIGLVLLDLSMPGLSGEETLIELQRINPNVCVILSSGYSESEVSQRFGDLGIADFIAKPYSIDKLIQTTRQLLGIVEHE